MNINVAIKYYSYTVSRNPHNVRALWGLYRSLLAKDKPEEDEILLLERVKDSINKIYSKKNPSLKIHVAL
jgi:hypothetical protein